MNSRINNIKIGILGGGQLGRMMIQAALDWDLHISVLDPDPEAPCKSAADRFVCGSLTEFDTVVQFGLDCDLVTIEIENVNTEALKELQSRGVEVYPQPEVIQLIQDKRTQKVFYQTHGIPTPEFVLLDHPENIDQHRDLLPGFYKLGKAGYDGRGVQRIEQIKDIEKAPDGTGLLEKLVNFKKEISVVGARTSQGAISTFPTVELVFHPHHNLVEYLLSPAEISEEQHQTAKQLAIEVMEHLGIVGLLAVEMFLEPDGSITVNEVAPRPHNSGHHTIEANYTSQFQQHLRVILGLPLGNSQAHTPAAMVNLLGASGYTGPVKYEGISQALKIPGVRVHIYGKKLTKPFRKMGHVTIVDSDTGRLIEKVNLVKEIIKVVS